MAMRVLFSLLIVSPTLFAQEAIPLPAKEQTVVEKDMNEVMLEQQQVPYVNDSSDAFSRVSRDGELKQKVDVKDSTQNLNNYVSLQGGALNYPRFANLPTVNGAIGVTLGRNLWTNFSLEGGFLYSFQQQEINQLNRTFIEDIDQYMFSAQFKYNWVVPSWDWLTLSPGLVGTYNRKVFEAGENQSDAFDAGVSATANFRLTQTFSIGLEYRFMANLDYARESATSPTAAALQQLATGSRSVNLEEAEYQLVLLSLIMGF